MTKHTIERQDAEFVVVSRNADGHVTYTRPATTDEIIAYRGGKDAETSHCLRDWGEFRALDQETVQRATFISVGYRVAKDREGPASMNELLSDITVNAGTTLETTRGEVARAGRLLGLIDQWGRDRNIIGDGTSGAQMLKLGSEFGELCDAVAKRDSVAVMDGLGDMVVVLAMIAGIEGVSLTDCIEHAYNEIKDRRGVLFDGVFVKESDVRYSDVLDQIADRRRAQDAQARDRAAGPLSLDQMFNDGITTDMTTDEALSRSA